MHEYGRIKSGFEYGHSARFCNYRVKDFLLEISVLSTKLSQATLFFDLSDEVVTHVDFLSGDFKLNRVGRSFFQRPRCESN